MKKHLFIILSVVSMVLLMLVGGVSRKTVWGCTACVYCCDAGECGTEPDGRASCCIPDCSCPSGTYRAPDGTCHPVGPPEPTDPPCDEDDWGPAESTVCAGQSFTQENDCGDTRTRVGTMVVADTYGACSTGCGNHTQTVGNICKTPSSWTAACGTCTECVTCNPQCGQTRNCNPACSVDTALLRCDGNVYTQYSETPQRTGTMWSEIRGTNYQINSYTITDSTAFYTWSNTSGQDDMVAYPGTRQADNTTWRSTIDVGSHGPATDTVTIHPYMSGCGQASKFCAAGSFKRTPKTCSVSIGSTLLGDNQTLGVTTTGDANTNPGSGTVRTFVEAANGARVTAPISYTVGSNNYTAVEQTSNGRYYYELVNAACTSTDSSVCTSNFILDPPPGDFAIHCDLPSDLPGVNNYAKCSGNPFCNYEGGTIDCSGANWASCSSSDHTNFKVQALPELTRVDIARQASSANIPVEVGNRNQICQTDGTGAELFPSRYVRYLVYANHVDGGDKVNRIDLNIGAGNTFSIRNLVGSPFNVAAANIITTGTAVSSVTATQEVRIGGVRLVVVDVTYPANYGNTNLGALSVVVYDNFGAINLAADQDANRSFKIWNCQVPVLGTLYDSSGIVVNCPTDTAFTNRAPADMNFDTVFFNASVDTFDRTFNAANEADYGGQSGDYLTWGKIYTANLNPDLEASVVRSKWRGTTNYCPNLQATLNQALVDAYGASPVIRVDFTAIRNQDPWFRSEAAGIQSQISISNPVPVTCDPAGAIPCTPAMSISNAFGSSGLVSAPSINGVCGTCSYGDPVDAHISRTTVDNLYGYTYLLNAVYHKSGIGVTLTNTGTDPMSFSAILANTNVGQTGVVFVNSGVGITIDTDNVVPRGRYLVLITNGPISVAPNVNNIEGVFVTDSHFDTLANANAANNNPLLIGGSVYAKEDIHLGRGYPLKGTNNSSPAVQIVHRPDFMFNIPSNVFNKFTGWKESAN